MKTYSIVFENESKVMIVNYEKYESPEEIDWEKVENYCVNNQCLSYGYQYCHNSNEYHPKSIKIIKTIRH
jgi:hypothetical protein